MDMRIKRDAATLQITGLAWVCAELFSDRERRVYTLTIYACVYVLPVCVVGFAYGVRRQAAVAYRCRRRRWRRA